MKKVFALFFLMFIVILSRGYSQEVLKTLYDGAIWVIKTDSSGDTLWTRTFETKPKGTEPKWLSWDSGRWVRETADGGYIVGGGTRGSQQMVVKLDSEGNDEWIRDYSGFEEASFIQPTYDGGYILTVYTDSTEYSSGKYIRTWGEYDRGIEYSYSSYGLLKLASDGNDLGFLWPRAEDRNKERGGIRHVHPTRDSGYILTGRTYEHLAYDEKNSSIGISGLYLEKIDAQGRTQWIRTYEGEQESPTWGEYVIESVTGGYMVIGLWNEKPTLFRIDSAGDLLWTWDMSLSGSVHPMSVPPTPQSYCLYQLPDTGYVFAGYLSCASYIMRIGPYGTVLWGKIELYPRQYRYVAPTPDKGFIATGYVYKPDDSLYFHSELLLAKFDSLGTLEWERSYKGEYYTEGNCVQPTSDGGYIITGLNPSAAKRIIK